MRLVGTKTQDETPLGMRRPSERSLRSPSENQSSFKRQVTPAGQHDMSRSVTHGQQVTLKYYRRSLVRPFLAIRTRQQWRTYWAGEAGQLPESRKSLSCDAKGLSLVLPFSFHGIFRDNCSVFSSQNANILFEKIIGFLLGFRECCDIVWIKARSVLLGMDNFKHFPVSVPQDSILQIHFIQDLNAKLVGIN